MPEIVPRLDLYDFGLFVFVQATCPIWSFSGVVWCVGTSLQLILVSLPA